MKICSICKETKNKKEFNKHRRRKDGLQSHCRVCNRARSRAYYSRNRKAHIREIHRRNKIYNKQKTDKLLQYFLKHPCIDCGESNPVVLEFDHVTGKKEFSIGTALRLGKSWSNILIEIQKCEVRCANCHRTITHIRNKSFRSLWIS